MFVNESMVLFGILVAHCLKLTGVSIMSFHCTCMY